MDYFIDKENDIVKIITCSDDKTAIYWNIPIKELMEQDSVGEYKHIYYSKYIRHIFYLGNEINFSNFKIKPEKILSLPHNIINASNTKEEDEYNLTAVRFSPCGNYISIGDTFGNFLLLIFLWLIK